MVVEFDKGQRIEIFPGLGKSAFGDHAFIKLGMVDHFEKVIQFTLNGPFEHIDEQEDHDSERKASFSDKCFI